MADLAVLFVAIAAEVAATCLLKSTHGLTRLWPTVGVGVGYLVAFALLARTLERLPVGPVYAVWAGVGTAAAATVGLVWYGDRLPAPAWAGVGLIVAGVVLLGLYAPHRD